MNTDELVQQAFDKLEPLHACLFLLAMWIILQLNGWLKTLKDYLIATRKNDQKHERELQKLNNRYNDDRK